MKSWSFARNSSFGRARGRNATCSDECRTCSKKPTDECKQGMRKKENPTKEITLSRINLNLSLELTKWHFKSITQLYNRTGYNDRKHTLHWLNKSLRENSPAIPNGPCSMGLKGSTSQSRTAFSYSKSVQGWGSSVSAQHWTTPYAFLLASMSKQALRLLQSSLLRTWSSLFSEVRVCLL